MYCDFHALCIHKTKHKRKRKTCKACSLKIYSNEWKFQLSANACIYQLYKKHKPHPTDIISCNFKSQESSQQKYLTEEPLYCMHIFHFHAIINVSDISSSPCAFFLLSTLASVQKNVLLKIERKFINNNKNVCNIVKLFSYERHNFTSHATR